MSNQMFKHRVLCRSVVALMAMLAHQQASSSDASIYSNPAKTQATSTAMFLLDNSGSMTYDSSYDGTTDVRIKRLREGMQRVLVGDASGPAVKPKAPIPDVNLGLSHFTTSTTGRIAVPALLSEDRAALTINGAQNAATIYPNSATFRFYNQRDGLGSNTQGLISLIGSVVSTANLLNLLQLGNAPVTTANVATGLEDNFWYVGAATSAYFRYHIDIPKGAVVTDARLVLPHTRSLLSLSLTELNKRVEMEDVAHAAPISANPVTMTNRFGGAPFSLTVALTLPDLNILTRGQLSFNVTNMIQDQVNRSDWCGMNAVNFRLRSTLPTEDYAVFPSGKIGNTEQDEDSQPYLQVTWSVTPAVRANTCMGKRTERQVNSPAWTVGEDYVTNLDQMTQRHYVNLEMNRLLANTVTPTARAYAETAAYMLGTSTNGQTGNGYSRSTDNAKTATGTGGTYRSPLPPNAPAAGSVPTECVSNGIFTLTDGQPNNSSSLTTLAQTALGNSSLACSSTPALPNGTDANSGWACIGGMSQNMLNNYQNNARKYQIRSVVVGFGPSNFWKGTSTDAVNAQNWGSVALGGGFKALAGGGRDSGFVNAISKNEVVSAVQRFFDSFENFSAISSNGSGVAPGSFGSAGPSQRYVYYPLFDPKVNESYWAGNMKRYRVDINTVTSKRTVVDANNTPVLKLIKQNGAADEQSSTFNTATTDLWSSTPSVLDGGEILQGGVVSKIPDNRRLLVDLSVAGTALSNGNTLTEINPAIDSGAQTTLLNAMTTLMAPTNPILPNALTTNEQREYLKNYVWWLLNRDVKSLDEGVGQANYVRPTTVVKRMGGVFHSQPEIITTKITRTVNNGVESTAQTDYIMFGTMQGLVHVVNAQTGGEEFVFAPSELLNTAKTIMPPSNQIKVGNTLQNAPLFYGMDSQWTSFVERKKVGDTLTATKVNAYGGMRMGGNNYYALDLTGLGAGIVTPKLMFKITPTGNFSDLGQTWSQPVVANINVYNNGKPKKTRVLVFGGGYDPRYEATDATKADPQPPTYVPGSGATTSVLMPGGATQTFSGSEKGNAVYIVNAETGALIWSIGGNNAKVVNPDFKYSIPSSIKVTDRDADGLIDHLYFGDLGGQVFRIDLNNYNPSGFYKRAVKLADFNATDVVDGVRFYEPPSFAPINDKVNGGLRTGLLTLASGNMSQPMILGTQDYAFALFDNDVMSPDLLTRTTDPATTPASFSANNMVTLTNDVLASTVKDAIAPATGVGKKGWFFRLPSFSNQAPSNVITSGNGTSAKALVRTAIIDYILNVSAFDPNRNTNSCGAGIKGATTTYRICLPFGACGSLPKVDIRRTELAAGVGKPLLAGSVSNTLSIINDTPDPSSNLTVPTGNIKYGALTDEFSFPPRVEPMHRWREVISEKYQ